MALLHAAALATDEKTQSENWSPLPSYHGMGCDSKKYEFRYVGRSPISPLIDIELH
jgi:hypothetical protein